MDNLRTYSSINSTESVINVYAFIYVCFYHIKIKKNYIVDTLRSFIYTVHLHVIIGGSFVLYCFI